MLFLGCVPVQGGPDLSVAVSERAVPQVGLKMQQPNLAHSH